MFNISYKGHDFIRIYSKITASVWYYCEKCKVEAYLYNNCYLLYNNGDEYEVENRHNPYLNDITCDENIIKMIIE